MSFTLQVTFHGLYLAVLHDVDRRAAILLPDCRGLDSDNPPTHEDGTQARPHVGYLGFDLANLAGPSRSGGRVAAGDASRGPKYEVVHRFNGEALEFDLGDDAAGAETRPDDGRGVAESAPTGRFDVEALSLPDLARVAPTVKLDTSLITSDVQNPRLLSRTLIRGGSLSGGSGGQDWVIPPTLNEAPDDVYRRTFAGFIKWTRRVEASEVTVRLRRFGGNGRSDDAEFNLCPSGGDDVVALRVANLCSVNPLEWPEFEARATTYDIDFKWLFKLLAPRDGKKYEELLLGAELPYPRVDLGSGGSMEPKGDAGCTGGTLYSRF